MITLISSFIVSLALSFWLPRFRTEVIGFILAVFAVFLGNRLLREVYLAQGEAGIWSVVFTGILLGTGLGYGIKSCLLLFMKYVEKSSSASLVTEQIHDAEQAEASDPIPR